MWKITFRTSFFAFILNFDNHAFFGILFKFIEILGLAYPTRVIALVNNGVTVTLKDLFIVRRYRLSARAILKVEFHRVRVKYIGVCRGSGIRACIGSYLGFIARKRAFTREIVYGDAGLNIICKNIKADALAVIIDRKRLYLNTARNKLVILENGGYSV